MLKTIWSSNGDLDNYIGMSVEDKRRELSNWYDSEMVDQLSDDDLDTAIADGADIFYDQAADDFEYNISPMIQDQVLGGFIIDEDFNIVLPDALVSNMEGPSAQLDEDETGDLIWDVEGRRSFKLIGFSNDQSEFINQLDALGILSTMHNLYPNQDDEDIDIYDIADLIPFDREMLEQVLTHVKNTGNLGESVEELDEAKAKNANKLAQELEEIKELADEYGREYFTQMPFTAYDNDPISIEMQYPEFFRIVKAFFKEMEILSPEELNDPDELDMQWDQGIDQHDWDVLMRACDKLAQSKGVQFEKEYKTGYNTPLDDDEILANREKEESLNEDGVSVFDGEYEVGKAYTPNIDLYMADDFRDLIFSEDEESEARQLGMIQDDESLVIPAGTKMIYVGDGGGGWPEFRVGEFLDFDIVDSNDEGYVLYPIDESLNEDTATWPWGDPNSALPRKEEQDDDYSEIDKYL